MTGKGQQTSLSRMRIDENAEFTVVGLGPEGILEGSYNVINEYAAVKRQRLDERSHWAYLSVPNYEVFHALVIGKAGENTVSDTNFNLQLGLAQIYIEAQAELKEAVRSIKDITPASEAEQNMQNQVLMKSRHNLQEITTSLRNSWDLQAALHVWRAHWQGGRPQKRFDQVLYQEILDAWKVLRDRMGEADDLVGVGWLDGWVKGFLEVYGCDDDFFQQLMTWNMIHDVGDADFGHDSIRLWQAEINKFRFKHRKLLDIASTMAGIKERMVQFRVMIMDPGSYHGWAAGGWYWQVKTDQFRSLATQLVDLEFRQRLQEHPDSQHKFEELDRLALDIYMKQTIDSFKNLKKSSQAVQMLQIWHATFGLLINYDMICTGYLWSYIRSTSQMDTDVFILTYQDVEVKTGGWTCPNTVDLVANFQIGLRGFIKRRVESRIRRKKNSKPKAKPTVQDSEGTEAVAQSTRMSQAVTQQQEFFSLEQFENAELIHDDGKRIQVEEIKSHVTNQPNLTDENQASGPAKHQIEGEKASKKKKKKSSKKKGRVSAEGITAAITAPPTGDLVRAVTEKGALAPDIENSTETTDIDDAWQAAKKEFIGHRTGSEGDPLVEQPGEKLKINSCMEDSEGLNKMDVPQTPEVGPPTSKATSTFNWFDETNDPTRAANEEWFSITAQQIQIETSKSRTAGEDILKENKAKIRPGIQWSEIVGGSKAATTEKSSGPSIANTERQAPRSPIIPTAGKAPSNISRKNDQAKKKSKISSDQKGKGKLVTVAKDIPPPQKVVQGPIGHILPSIGPWTEVSKKKKQTGTENESKYSSAKDKVHGEVKLRTEIEHEEGLKIPEKSTAAPAPVVESKMKEISNLLNESGKGQIPTRAAGADPPTSSRNVLRIVSKQAQPRRASVKPSPKTGVLAAIKNNQELATRCIASESSSYLDPTPSQLTLDKPNEPQGQHSGSKHPSLSLGRTHLVGERMSKLLSTVSPIITDLPAVVKKKSEEDLLKPTNAPKSPLMPFSPAKLNTSTAHECQGSISAKGLDVRSPTALGDTSIPGRDSEGSIQVTKQQITDGSGEILKGESQFGSIEPTGVPGKHRP